MKDLGQIKDQEQSVAKDLKSELAKDLKSENLNFGLAVSIYSVPEYRLEL
jgi:hypothetical protein